MADRSLLLHFCQSPALQTYWHLRAHTHTHTQATFRQADVPLQSQQSSSNTHCCTNATRLRLRLNMRRIRDLEKRASFARDLQMITSGNNDNPCANALITGNYGMSGVKASFSTSKKPTNRSVPEVIQLICYMC